MVRAEDAKSGEVYLLKSEVGADDDYVIIKNIPEKDSKIPVYMAPAEGSIENRWSQLYSYVLNPWTKLEKPTKEEDKRIFIRLIFDAERDPK
jgi:hypothetical protein